MIAFFLAKQLNTQIISCDSKQFYKQLNIGSFKINNFYLQQIKHHFINNINIWDTPYTVKNFEIDTLNKLEKLFIKHKTVLMVGGSGLYEKAVIEGLNKIPNIP